MPRRSDPARRAVYDLYGHEGLQAGLQLGPRLRSREEIRAEFEALKATRLRQQAEARVAYRGSYIFGAARCHAAQRTRLQPRAARAAARAASSRFPPPCTTGFSAADLVRPPETHRGNGLEVRVRRMRHCPIGPRF